MKAPKFPLPADQPTLTVAQAAPLLQCAESTVYAGINAGDIPHIRVGRKILIPTAALRSLLGLDRPEEAAAS